MSVITIFFVPAAKFPKIPDFTAIQIPLCLSLDDSLKPLIFMLQNPHNISTLKSEETHFRLTVTPDHSEKDLNGH
jgi:hypothetical protein